MRGAGLKPTIFTGVHVELMDESFSVRAVEIAGDTDWDAGRGLSAAVVN